MIIDVHVHFDSLDSDARAHRKLDLILARLDALGRQETTMNADLQARLDALAVTVANIDSVVDSNDALLTELSAMIAELKSTTTDPATLQRIDDLGAAIDASRTKLNAAVIANTPAA